ncbi:hypothetical protein RI054_19g88200 [Pseudoscourfieldia marina]
MGKAAMALEAVQAVEDAEKASLQQRPKGPSAQAWHALPYTRPSHYDCYEAILERREWSNPYPVGSARWRVAEQKRKETTQKALKAKMRTLAPAVKATLVRAGAAAVTTTTITTTTTTTTSKATASIRTAGSERSSASRRASARALELRREHKRVRDEHAALEAELVAVSNLRNDATRQLEVAHKRWVKVREERESFDAEKAEQAARHLNYKQQRERIAVESTALDVDMRDLESERDALYRTRVALEAARLALSDARIEHKLRSL